MIPELKRQLAFILLPRAYYLLTTLNLASCSKQTFGQQQLDQLRQQGQNWIYSTWHENTAIAVWGLRNQNLAMMASDSDDGEYIARGIAAFGNIPVRGSSSAGGARATRELVRYLKRGNSAAITPDGPRGPRRELQMGVITLAAVSGAPLVPYHIEATRQWELTSWDRHRIPKPFSSVIIGIGEPYYVDKERFKTDAEPLCREFEALMIDHADRIRQLAQHV